MFSLEGVGGWWVVSNYDDGKSLKIAKRVNPNYHGFTENQARQLSSQINLRDLRETFYAPGQKRVFLDG
ncbi:MAG: hypothetical protein WC238_05905, partial [Parcubacteria group bacterium]